MKLQSWLLLAILAILVSFAAGIRQGIVVEKKNSKVVHFYEVADKKCGIQYLLPDTVIPESRVVSVNCDTQASGAAAMLTKDGYTPATVATSGGVMKVWMRAPQELQLLLHSTLKSINPHE